MAGGDSLGLLLTVPGGSPRRATRCACSHYTLGEVGYLGGARIGGLWAAPLDPVGPPAVFAESPSAGGGFGRSSGAAHNPPIRASPR